ncbi:hypothetical protein [Chloroflexus sp.]|uniref:hypothetical protein n=1 Tax=Chloroflexus sp. TaxID=1904827 RepID=UPI002ACE96B0|nr:hypothetical protein [Chloroflexus sp.]
MDLTIGIICYVQDHKDEGMIRLPPMSKARSPWYRTIGGATFANPIPTTEYLLMTNTLA